MTPSPTTWPEPGHWCRPPRREGLLGLKLGLLSRTPRLPCSATSFMYILLHSSWRAGVRGSSHPDPSWRPSCCLCRPPERCPGTPWLSGQSFCPKGPFLSGLTPSAFPESMRRFLPRPSQTLPCPQGRQPLPLTFPRHRGRQGGGGTGSASETESGPTLGLRGSSQPLFLHLGSCRALAAGVTQSVTRCH